MPMGKKAEHIFKTFTFPDSVRQPEVYAATDKGADISLISESAYQALPECPKLNLLPEVKEELDLMLEEDIIEEVTEPNNWCAPMVSVVKPNGKVRICDELGKYNEAVKRERYILLNWEHVDSKLARAKVFSKLEASSS